MAANFSELQLFFVKINGICGKAQIGCVLTPKKGGRNASPLHHHLHPVHTSVALPAVQHVYPGGQMPDRYGAYQAFVFEYSLSYGIMEGYPGYFGRVWKVQVQHVARRVGEQSQPVGFRLARTF